MICSDGYIRDMVYFSILADEWPAIKARLSARLEIGGKPGSSWNEPAS